MDYLIYMVYDGMIYIYIYSHICIYVYKHTYGDYHIVSLWTLYGIIIHIYIYYGLFHQIIWGYDGILMGMIMGSQWES